MVPFWCLFTVQVQRYDDNVEAFIVPVCLETGLLICGVVVFNR